MYFTAVKMFVLNVPFYDASTQLSCTRSDKDSQSSLRTRGDSPTPRMPPARRLTVARADGLCFAAAMHTKRELTEKTAWMVVYMAGGWMGQRREDYNLIRMRWRRPNDSSQRGHGDMLLRSHTNYLAKAQSSKYEAQNVRSL